MKIAVEGCSHGELDKIYETIAHLEEKNDAKVDLLIICGDFQAVRNRSDLQCMAVPRKYQKLNTFYKYYSGEKVAPVLTIFIGGNHEASNYLSELPYGGWVCPNIYYMGYANVINVNGVRIAGLSGIYKGHDYLKGHFEILPYDEAAKRSVYHIRNLDVFRLKQISQPVDICISHDWPRGVYNHGDKAGLLRFKPFFKDDIENDKLGSRPTEELLNKLAPNYWFAAHLHCKFAALIPHEKDGQKSYTKFLSLDKCLPHRRFLQILDIGEACTKPLQIEYDKEWLSVLRSTNHLLNVSTSFTYMPGPGCTVRWDFSATDEELKDIENLFEDFTIPQNFIKTAAPHDSSSVIPSFSGSPELHVNPQTTVFCKNLGIDDPIEILIRNSPSKRKVHNYSFVEDLDVTNTSQSSVNLDETSFAEDSLSDDKDSSQVISSELDTTGSSGFFYIDTRKMKNMTSSPVFTKFKYNPTPLPSSMKNISQDFPEFKEQNTEEQELVETEISPVKVMKRRNRSLYKDDDNVD